MPESGRNWEPGQDCFLLAVAKSCCFSPLASGISCSSYLWIVPISSIRNGQPQDHYWLPGQERSNPALP